ncbi:hypothetical protein KY289_026496 [Solanum tuberosum]|nr:hypothetical protein KY289_026496 [Solanum tuberosum]
MDLKGYDIRQGVESENIQQIVNQISLKLCKTLVSYLQDVVGIDTHLEEVKFQLKLEINEVRSVGIWGMGRISKTTIARAIFDTLSYQFEAASFIVDIKEKKCGMHSLQNILLSELLRKKDNYVNNKEDEKHMIAHRLRFKKVLVVLDDIDHRDHLDYLAGNSNWYGNGSRIVATTRDKHLIETSDVIYEVTTLVDHEAIKLFNQYAFVKKEVPDEYFEKLSMEVVHHAKCLPLPLKVWGSLLHKRDITEWRSAMEEMKNNSNSEIVEKLRISYDRLEAIQKDIFLDIACFFRGKDKDYNMKILESCYSGANIGLRVLIDKSLVFISINNTIEMHDLIQEMGKHVVKMHKDLGEPSRIWNIEDFKEVIDSNTELLPCLRWQDLSFSKRLMQTPNFTGMPNLECLNLEKCSSLIEVHSSLGLLKFGDISRNHWKNEVGVRDKGDLENLEELDASCTRISQPPSSIVQLNKLKSLSFSGQCLEDGVHFVFPQVNEGLRSLEILNLSFYNLIDGGLPEDIGCLSSLKELHLNGNNFVHLPESIAQLGDLETLYLSNCKRLPQLPEFSNQLHTISADWSNDLICNSLFQNISSASDS